MTEPLVVSQSLLVIGCFYYLPAILAYAAAAAKDQKRRAAVLLSALASVVLTRAVPWSSWPAYRQSGLWEHFLSYWRVRVVGHAASLVPGRQAVIGVSPHGIVPYSLGLLAFGRLQTLFNSPRIVIASVVRWIPVFAQVLLWGGAVEATDSAIAAALAAGDSIALTPGGIAEMFTVAAGSVDWDAVTAEPKREVAVLASRKGFIRHALRSGAALVPVYCFGANELFQRVRLPDAVTALSRYLRASLLFFTGRLGLPVPFARSIVYAVGQAVLLSPTPSPTQEEIDFVHNAFVRSLGRAFDEHKAELGGAWASARLDIV